MSADNGVYILESIAADGGSEFRVAHAQAIENAYYIPRGMMPEPGKRFWNLTYTWDIWRRSQVFHDKDAAFSAAREMEAELDICEYGVCHEYMARPFPTAAEAKEFEAQAEAVEKLWRPGSLADNVHQCREYSLEYQARQGAGVARLQRAARAMLDLTDKDITDAKVIEAVRAELRAATEECEQWKHW